MISSSDGLFWRSAFVKSWILSAVHSIQLLDYSRNTMVREPRSIFEELEQNWSLVFHQPHCYGNSTHPSNNGTINPLVVNLAYFEKWGPKHKYLKNNGKIGTKTLENCVRPL